MEASHEGGQDPEGAVAPWMDGWMDGWCPCLLSFFFPRSKLLFHYKNRESNCFIYFCYWTFLDQIWL